MTAMQTHCDPTFFSEAVNEQQCCDAMNSELNPLEENGSWHTLPCHQIGKLLAASGFTKPRIDQMGQWKERKLDLLYSVATSNTA